MAKLKLPQVLPKKPIIKGVPNTIVVGGGVLAAAGATYYAYTQGWIPTEITSLFEGLGARCSRSRSCWFNRYCN